jgi:hypothetical protein
MSTMTCASFASADLLRAAAAAPKTLSHFYAQLSVHCFDLANIPMNYCYDQHRSAVICVLI